MHYALAVRARLLGILSVVVAAAALATLAARATAAPARSAALPEGAALVSAATPAFVSVSTALDSPQLQRAQALLGRFPGGPPLLQSIRDELGKQGLDFDRDVRPAIGGELDFAWLDLGNGGRNAVALLRPPDLERFAALLRAANKDARPGERIHDILAPGGWVVLSNRPSQLARFRTFQSMPKLADDPRFARALGAQPADALVRAYAGGPAVMDALGAALRARVASICGRAPQRNAAAFDWGSVAATADGSGLSVALDAAAPSSAGAPAPRPFAPKLLAAVPAGALAVASFDGSGAGSAIGRLQRQCPGLARQLSTLEAALGVRLATLASLAGREGVLYVRPGRPIPEVTLILEPARPAGALAVLDALAARAGALGGGAAAPARKTIGGVMARRVRLGPVSLFYGLVGNRLVLTTSPAGVAALARRGGARLADDARFRAATRQAGVPARTSGLVYVDLARALPLVENLARAGGTGLSPEVRANLRPLRSLVGWSTGDGRRTTGRLFLGVG